MSKTITKSSPGILVRVLPGCVLFRHGRGWREGQTVVVRPSDAERLVHEGSAEIVRG
jgi:hypothetical protein